MAWRRARGITRPIFADVARFSERKLATYEKQKSLPAEVVRPVRESLRLLAALGSLCGDAEALADWLRKRNAAFENRAPLELIKRGEADRLWEMVHQVRHGAFA